MLFSLCAILFFLLVEVSHLSSLLYFNLAFHFCLLHVVRRDWNATKIRESGWKVVAVANCLMRRLINLDKLLFSMFGRSRLLRCDDSDYFLLDHSFFHLTILNIFNIILTVIIKKYLFLYFLRIVWGIAR